MFNQKGKGGGAGGGEVSLEDAAEVCVRCLGAPPKPGRFWSLTLQTGRARRGRRGTGRGSSGASTRTRQLRRSRLVGVVSILSSLAFRRVRRRRPPKPFAKSNLTGYWISEDR